MTQQEINTRAYSALSPVEASILIHYREDVMSRPVLDLGCGAGRLAPYLRLLTPRYVGLDVSPHTIAHCQREFPDLRFVQGDMRELAPFGDGSLGAVFALSNLIDAVDHEDRVRVIQEVHRVLMPGGLFVFSAHNRNWALAGPPQGYTSQQRQLANAGFTLLETLDETGRPLGEDADDRASSSLMYVALSGQ